MKRLHWYGHRAHRLIQLSVILLLTGAGIASSDDYSKWSHSQYVVLNTTASGANIAGNLRNFPLLIRLNPGVFSHFAQTLPGGADIRFAKKDGTHLPYQIERWADHAGDNDTAEIWVLLDTVYGNNAVQSFLMYWGKTDAADSSESSAVFDTANSFRAVWHLDEATGDTIHDATINNFRGEPVGTLKAGLPSATGSAVGTGKQFLNRGSDTGSCIQILDPDTVSGKLDFDTTAGYSLSAWVKIDSFGAGGFFLAKRQYELFYSAKGQIGFSEVRGSSLRYLTNSDSLPGQWRHVVVVHKPGALFSVDLYVDGKSVGGTVSTFNNLTTANSIPEQMQLGSGLLVFTLKRLWLTGAMDEIRIESTTRSGDWVKLSYENQKGVRQLITFAKAATIVSEPVDTTVPSGATASFVVGVEGSDTLSYRWLRFPADSVGNAGTFSLPPVTAADNGARFRCIVRNGFGTDSSRWATLNVIDTPRITTQPHDAVVAVGESASFTVTVKDTLRTTYSWRKAGNDKTLGTAGTLNIADVAAEDSGGYYCIIVNPAAGIRSDTANLRIGETTTPVTSFTASPATGCAPLHVSFTNRSTGAITSHSWKFGDNTTDTATNPIHMYAQPGRYTVILIVNGPDGTDTLVKIESIVVDAPCPAQGNSIVIDTAYYDSLSESIRLSWCIDSMVAENGGEAVVAYDIGRYPTSPAKGETIALRSGCTAATLRLNEPVCIGATYYIAIWLRPDANTMLEPTDSSKAQVRTGSSSREVVVFFDPGRTTDTVTTFGGKIILWKDEGYTARERITDTLEIITPEKLPGGLIPVGTPFRFRSGDVDLPFFIGIRIDSLPRGTSLSEVRIYNDSAGTYFVNYETVIDSAHNIVYVKTDDLHLPFIAMVDTVKPSVTVYGDTALPIVGKAAPAYSVGIVDNIANVRWRFLYGSGDQAPVLRAGGDMKCAETMLSLTIADTAAIISPESGIRILLITGDGIHTDTLNLSRCVYRSQSDALTTNANVWTPVYSTAVLDAEDANFIVGQLADFHGVTSYKKRTMRLYRWYGNGDNNGQSDKWIEYDPNREDIQSLFTFEPGKLIWLKTLKNTPFHLGSGYTLSLKDTFNLDLPPQQWTDFGMPYRFGVRVEDIRSATGSDADSVQFYRWKQDSTTKLYALDPLYVTGMPDNADRSQTIDYLPHGGYSFYNRSSQSVRLRIPPIPAVMTGTLKKNTKAEDSLWSAKFVALADDRTRLPAVYFGYAPGSADRDYPLAPSFSALRLSVLDRVSSKQYGHFISREAKDGLVKELLICNNDDSAHTIRFRLEQVGAFPEKYTAHCSDAIVNNSDVSGTITIAAHTTVSRWVVVGDAAFHQNFHSSTATRQFSLHPLYPNPFRSMVNIRYMVPFGAMEKVNIAIFSVLGKKVWKKNIDGLLSEGLHQIAWDGRNENGVPVGSGLYIVQLNVENREGKVTGRFERQATLLR